MREDGHNMIQTDSEGNRGEHTVRILAISGSLRASSTNTALVRAIAAMAPTGMDVTLYDGLGDLPHFSPDLDDEKSPAAVIQLRALLRAADGVLICTPEYAFGVPGSLKNALDWTVSSGDLNEKPVAAISASPLYSGGDKAHASLLLTLTARGDVDYTRRQGETGRRRRRVGPRDRAGARGGPRCAGVCHRRALIQRVSP